MRRSSLQTSRIFSALALVLAAAPCHSVPVRVPISGVDTEFYRHSNQQPPLAIDGDISTYSWITESFSQGNPTISTWITMANPAPITRIRIRQENWYNWNTVGGNHDFNIFSTTDSTPSLNGSWTLASNVSNGYLGEELVSFAGGGMNQNGWHVYHEDQQYSEGWFSISFDPMVDATTAVQLEWVTNAPASYDHWALFEIEAYADLPAMPMQLSVQTHGQLATGTGIDVWEFLGLAGQQIRLDSIAMAPPGVVFDLNGPGNWIGFSGISGTSEPYTLPETGLYHVIVRGMGAEGAIPYAFRVKEASIVDLNLGIPHEGGLAGSGQAQLFRAHLATGSPMRVRLDDTASNNSNEIYARHGIPPDRGHYDYRFEGSTGPDQQVTIPLATPGDWYVLMYSGLVVTPSAYSLVAETSDLLATSVSPSHHGNAADAVLTIAGAGFDETVDATLEDPSGPVFGAAATDVHSFSELSATFSAGSVPAGVYDVVISSGSGASDRLDAAFEVVDGGGAVLETGLSAPGTVGYHSVATIWTTYQNSGDLSMPAPLLVFRAAQEGREAGILRLGDTVPPRGFWTSTMPEGFSTSVQFLATGDTPGTLQPGESRDQPVQYAGWLQPWDFSYPPINFELGVLDADEPTVVDWPSLKDGMRPPDISAEVWDVLWSNFVTEVGTTWGDYVAMLSDNATYLSNLGLQVRDIGDLLRFEFAQAGGMHVLRQINAATDAYAAAPGMDLSFQRTFPLSIRQRFELGALGFGWSHNWDYRLIDDGEGTIKVHGPGGSLRIFQDDIRPGHGYFSLEGDHGTLTDLGGGTFQLQETSGMRRVFDAGGLLDYVEDTDGNRITCVRTGERLDALSHSGGQNLQLAYNAAGRLSSVTDPDGRVTSYGYDASGEHLVSATYFNGQTVDYSYSFGAGLAREHALVEAGAPCCGHQYFTYDDRGRLSTISRDAGAEQVTFAYGPAGKITMTDAIGNASHFYLDHNGLLVRVTDGLGRTTRLAYDGDFNLTRVTDPAGRSHVYAYDGDGNLVSATDPLGNQTSLTYDGPYDRMTRLTDAKGNTTDYAYDPATANLASITYDDGSVEGWQYDMVGNPQRWINRRTTPIDYEWDADGRIAAKIYQDGTRTDYAYDARGNLTFFATGDDTTSLDYDGDDRLAQITYPGGQYLVYTYDAGGRRESSTNQLGHRLDYHYDVVGRLESMTDETAALVVSYQYDSAGRLVRKELGNGVYTTYEYDTVGQLTSLINYKPDDSVLSQFLYAYDSRGRRTSMTTVEGTWTYGYDDLGQLTSWTAPDGRHVEYVYDALGNRVTETDDGAVTEYVTNGLNQYETVGDRTYFYDLDGNLTSEVSPSGTTTYAYDNENRLAAVSSPEGDWTYAYDGLGSRTRISESGAETDLVIDPTALGNLVGEYDRSGVLLARYSHGLGLVARVDDSSTATFYSFDAIGNTSELTDTNAVPVNTYSYDPFGTAIVDGGLPQSPFEFGGELGVMRDGGHSQFMRARSHLPSIGRFGSQDPLGLVGGQVNLQAYCFNAPTQLVDPTGMIWTFGGTPVLGSPDRLPTIGQMAPAIGYGVRYGLSRLAPLAIRLAPWVRTGWFVVSNSVLEGVPYSGVAPDVAGLLWSGGRAVGGAVGGFLSSSGIGAAGLYAGAVVGGYLLGESLGNWLYDVTHPTPPGSAGATGASGVSGSRDPNQKTGPHGYGPDRLVGVDQLLGYKVEFENDSTATAPAQVVTVMDTLDTHLNPSTFQLTGIGFGDNFIMVPPHSQYFATTIPMTYNDVAFEVQVESGIHLSTGEVYAHFYSLDPQTGLPPAVNTGFLPPEDGTGRGQGYFTYRLFADSDTPEGTRIPNVAHITFDFLETIATNQIDPHDPTQGTDPEKEAYVTIAPSEVTLTVSSTDGGSVASPGEGSFLHAWDDLVSLAAQAEPGYEFVKWYGDVATVVDTTASSTTMTMNGDFAIMAEFQPAPNSFLRGDVNGDGEFDILDPIANLSYQQGMGAPVPGCLDAADCDDSGALDLADALYSLEFQYADGPEFPPPFTGCDFDPTTDALTCQAFGPCSGVSGHPKARSGKARSGGTGSLQLGAPRIDENGQVLVDLILTTNIDLWGYEFTVVYDPAALRYVGFNPSTTAEGADFFSGHNDGGTGELRVGCVPDFDLVDALGQGVHRLGSLALEPSWPGMSSVQVSGGQLIGVGLEPVRVGPSKGIAVSAGGK